MRINRRSFLRLASAIPLAPVLTCRPLLGGGVVGRLHEVRVRLDFSFAERALAGATSEELATHPAAAAMVRHQRMSGNTEADVVQLITRVLAELPNRIDTGRVIEDWRNRSVELTSAINAASAYLPANTPGPTELFVVVGYDIGVAAPPAILLNAGHERFLANPDEGVFFACHEAHHVGFLHHRLFPDLSAIGQPGVLGRVVDFITQMEGMAVHAAAPLRRHAKALGDDADYSVYTQVGMAESISHAWHDMRSRCCVEQPDAEATVAQVLNAMTSGERLAYRYGALRCKELEEIGGREGLVRTILHPEEFHAG